MVSIGRGSHRNRCDGPFGWGELTDLYGETGSDQVIWSMPLRPEDVPSDPARLVALVLALDTENERLLISAPQPCGACWLAATQTAAAE